MKYKIVLTSFPFDDLTGQKVRPALCLTNPIGTLRHVVLAYISSNVPTSLDQSDLLLEPGTSEYQASGLRVRSLIRLHRLITVTTSIIQRQLGSLTAPTEALVQQKLRTFLEL
jgi:mRNA interferase MazF